MAGKIIFSSGATFVFIDSNVDLGGGCAPIVVRIVANVTAGGIVVTPSFGWNFKGDAVITDFFPVGGRKDGNIFEWLWGSRFIVGVNDATFKTTSHKLGFSYVALVVDYGITEFECIPISVFKDEYASGPACYLPLAYCSPNMDPVQNLSRNVFLVSTAVCCKSVVYCLVITILKHS